MAKELPYFKFEPAEWQNGSIQMCSPESKMLFIDICCNYWQRLGDVPYAFALHAVCKGNEKALQELKQAGVIHVKDDKISIVFLDEQLEERISISDKARESARRRWDSKKNDANALQTQSKGNAKRKEKKRKEDKQSIDWGILIQYLNEKTGRRFQLINDKLKSKYRARLKEGYTKDNIRFAIDNAIKVQTHIDNGFQYLTPEFFSRSDTLDKYGMERKETGKDKRVLAMEEQIRKYGKSE